MEDWRRQLHRDPLSPLLSAGDDALVYWARRDLLGEDVGPASRLWALPAAARILRRQLPDGSWPRSGAAAHPAINYGLIEAWRQFRLLVAQYGLTREHPGARLAAEFLLSCQTEEGDIRGMLANQYAPYYTGAILGLLSEDGYADDPRIAKGLQWLLAMRQDDGGWTIPLLTHKLDRTTQYRLTSAYAEPLQPERSQPFSHNWTGMVLRAFAAHPVYRHSDAARAAGRLLASRFFQPDAYTSYRAASYWLRFDYPFWWNNLVSALDALTLLGFTREDEPIQRGAAWLVEHQGADGLWQLSYVGGRPERAATARSEGARRWVSLAICRVLRRLFG